jgi:hypothetical protein
VAFIVQVTIFMKAIGGCEAATFLGETGSKVAADESGDLACDCLLTDAFRTQAH